MSGTPRGPQPTVAIIGAGFGGICMAIQLKQAGITSFRIFEKAADVGGIWRDNTYPGCGCDVPSHLYSYSFDKYRSATRRYPEQPEILAYLRQMVDKYELRGHLQLNTEVTSAGYDDATGTWQLHTATGRHHVADVVVYAVGQLNRPRIPDIPGRDSFQGRVFHTAQWDHSHDLAQQRVAVIGTGSSAAQLVPHVAESARRLYVFQRTANWVIPKPNTEFAALTRLAFRSVPPLQTGYRAGLYSAADAVLWPVITKGWSARPVRWIAERHLRRQISDDQLRRKLAPDHPIGCKRIVIDSNYYPALTRDNVELVTDGIDRITSSGIETVDGAHRPVDSIIYATGFRTTEFLAPIEVLGRSGRSLHHQWRDGAEAYLGVAVPNFPNLFLLHGPNTILGHNSNVFMIECQVRYVLQCLQMLADRPCGRLEVRSEAMDDYRRVLNRAISRTVWQNHGCDSWYKTESGRVTNPWPGSSRRYRRLLRRPHPDDFCCIPGRTSIS